MPIVEAFSEGWAAVGASLLVAAGDAPSVSEGRVCIVDIGSLMDEGGGGKGLRVVGVVAVVREAVVEGVFDAGVLVGRVRVRDVLSPAPKMPLVRRLISELSGSIMSEYSDCIGAAMLVGSAEMSMSSAFVASAGSFAVVCLRSVAEAGLDPESAPTWLMALRRPPTPPAVLVAPLIVSNSDSRPKVLFGPVELLCVCAPAA